MIDLSAEKARLAKEIGKLEGEVKKVEAKLGNPGFMAKADDDVIEEHKERRDEAQARIDKLTAALGRLG